MDTPSGFGIYSHDHEPSPNGTGRRMKKIATLLTLFIAIAAGAAWAQEGSTPPTVGGSPSATRIANGQTVEVYYIVGQADVDFTEITATRVGGTATRAAGSSGTVTVAIRWVNRNMWTTLNVSDLPVTFSMESGDVDKRTNNQQSN